MDETLSFWQNIFQASIAGFKSSITDRFLRPPSDLDHHQQSQPPALHWHGFPHSPCTLFSQAWRPQNIAIHGMVKTPFIVQGCCQTDKSYTKNICFGMCFLAHVGRKTKETSPCKRVAWSFLEIHLTIEIVHFNMKIQKVVVLSTNEWNGGRVKNGTALKQNETYCWTLLKSNRTQQLASIKQKMTWKYMECSRHPGCNGGKPKNVILVWITLSYDWHSWHLPSSEACRRTRGLIACKSLHGTKLVPKADFWFQSLLKGHS